MMKMIQIHPVIRTINRIIYLKINKIKIVYGLGKVTQNQLKRNVVRKIEKLVEEYIIIVQKHVVKLVKDHVVSDRWTKRNETKRKKYSFKKNSRNSNQSRMCTNRIATTTYIYKHNF